MPPPVADSFSLDPRKGVVVLALALLTIGLCWLLPAEQAGSETGVVMELPYRIGPLWGSSEPVSQTELAVLPPDTTFARKTYGLPASDRLDQILCSIVLSGREKRSIHRPERCLPGQGWTVRDSQVVNVGLNSGRVLPVTALLLERSLTLENKQTVPLQSYYLYWYVGKNVSTPYSWQRVLLTNWDLIRYRLNQRWAYVIVSAYITGGLLPNGHGPEETLGNLKQFIRDSVPSFIKTEMPSGSIPVDSGTPKK